MNINRKNIYLATVALLLSLAGCKSLTETAESEKYSVPEGVTLMTESEIRDTLVGNTYKGESIRSPGSTYVEFIHADGGISGLWDGSQRYKGSWAISGPVWCYKYKSTSGCNTLARSGDDILWYDLDGSYRGGKSTVVTGDPENLSQ
jgi:hypothetical protein